MTPEMPVVRLTSPGEIVAAVPHLCGFVPTESLVAVSLRGERKRIGLSLRFDLVPAELDDEVADQVAGRLAHDGAASMVLVLYTDEAGPRPREPLARTVIDAVELRGITVLEALHVAAGRWSSYTCSHPDCCPPEGTPVPPAPDLLAATAAYDAVRGSRSASSMMSDSFEPRPCSRTTRGAAGSVDPAVATTGAGKAVTPPTVDRLEGQLPAGRGAQVQRRFGRTTDGLGDLDALHGVSLGPGPCSSYRVPAPGLEKDDVEAGAN
jgi:hypothetical protein